MYRRALKHPGSIAVTALLLVIVVPTVFADLDTARQDFESGQIQASIIRLKSLLQENPDDADARLLLGQIYLEDGEGRAAEQEIMRARDGGANDFETRVGLIRALLGQRELSRALEWTEPPADATPEQRAEILALHGSVLLAQEYESAAFDAFAEALNTAPGTLRATLGMAALEMARGDLGAARTTIDQAIADHPDNADAWQMLALLEERQQRPEAAVEALNKAIALSRSEWSLRYQRAALNLSLGKLDEAAVDIEAIRDQKGRLPTLAYLEGVLALRRGANAQAVERLEAYLRIKPGDTRAIYHAADALTRTGRTAQAEEYLLRLSAALPGNVAVHTLLARTRLALGNAKGAEEAIAPIINSAGATPLALENLRQSLIEQGRTKQASEVVRRAAKRFPELSSAQLAYAEQILTEGDHDGALKLLDRVLNEEPKNERALLLTIQTRIDQGNLDEAKSVTDLFLERLPLSPLAHTVRGVTLVQMQDVDAARAAFSRALEIDPTFEQAALALALLELESNRAQQARDVLAGLLSVDPDNGSVLLARALVTKRNSGVGAYEAQLQQALKANRDALPLRLALARSYLSRRDGEAALAVVEAAPPGQATAEPLLLLQAEAELLSKGPVAAATTAAELAERVPTDARYRYLLASLAAASGDLSSAEAYLEDGLAIDTSGQLQEERLNLILAAQPTGEARKQMIDRLLGIARNHPALRLVQAKLLAGQGDYDMALVILNDLHRKNRDDINYLLALASVKAKVESPKQAKSLLEEWLRKHPSNVRARMMLARLAIESSDSGLAIEQYKRVIETDPSNAFALNNLAMLSLRQDPVAALAYADRALQQQPTEPGMLDTKGAVLLAMGDYEAALPLLLKAHTASPEPGIAFRYAQALAGTGDEDGARRVLLTIQNESFPQETEADALFKRLSAGR